MNLIRIYRPFVLLPLLLGILTQAEARGADLQTESNVAVELSFATREPLRSPSFQTTVDCLVVAPSGQERRIPAFWAGGLNWRVRYASAEVGVHRYRLSVPAWEESGLHGLSGTIEVKPYQGTNPVYRHGPIRVADDRRHFAYADGTPFFWLGDTWWMGLSHRLRWPDEFARLADDRQAKGFNVVQIVAGLYPDMPAFDPRGANEAGFPWEPSYQDLRPDYFEKMDRRLSALIDRGITPCVVGMWGYYLEWMGPEKAKAHWRNLIARYASWPVVWCVAGEANLPWYQAPGFPYDDRKAVHGWTDILRYVRATDPYHRPLTIHPTAINEYTSRHATDDPTLLDFDLLQTPHGVREAADITLGAIRSSVAARPTMPVIDGEASYERLLDSIPTDWVRAMFWINLTSGAAGHTYGANGIWQCNRPGDPHGKSPTGGTYGTITWEEGMNLPGSGQLASARRFIEKFPWTQFEPHSEWVSQVDPASKGSAPPAHWIWHAEGNPAEDAPVAARFFRAEIHVPANRPIRRAHLHVGGDDQFKAWLDGREVTSGLGWLGHSPKDLTSVLTPGRHVLAIRGVNLAAPVSKNPAGLIAWVDIDYLDGETTRHATGPLWKSSTMEQPLWFDPGFDDQSWTAVADLGSLGVAPWGAPPAPRPFPPLAFGMAGGSRIIYAIETAPVRLSGLIPAQTYQLTRFDPVTGQSRDETPIRTDDKGSVLVADPGDGHDWAFALVPLK